MKKNNSKGFTLIELLIVIALIAVIAGAVFVALNPLQRFQDSRDSRRWSDVSNLLSAIKVNQVDNKGPYLWPITGATADTNYMVTSGTTTPCAVPTCSGVTPAPTVCLNLADLVTKGYLGSIPVSPNGAGSWTSSYTGYVITKTAAGAIKIQACEAEGGSAISVAR